MKSNVETRATNELRADKGGRLVGYAAVFESESEPLPWIETFTRGAFAESLRNGDDVRALREHKPELILGRLSAGTLALEEDNRGLRATIEPPNTQAGRETLELVRRGDLTQMSVAFRVIDQKWGTRDGLDYRQISRAELVDVSIVAFPAFPETTIGTRALDLWRTGNRAASSARRRRLEIKRTLW